MASAVSQQQRAGLAAGSSARPPAVAAAPPRLVLRCRGGRAVMVASAAQTVTQQQRRKLVTVSAVSSASDASSSSTSSAPSARAGPASPAAAAAIATGPLPAECDAVVVGAGLAGLHAAALLQRAGLSVALLEAGDAPGGRVRSDVVDGFVLDRGFQIFLTGYPYAREVLDFDALQLQPFYAGARVRYGGGWHTVADPLRHPVDGLLSLLNPIGSAVDKVNVGVFRLKSLLGPLDALLAAPETTIEQRLRAEGFSSAIADRFFRPFLGGIFFDTGLGTSSRLFAFVMRMLATGANCLPAAGIGAVADQLAAQLAPQSLYLGAKVARVEPLADAAAAAAVRVTLADGRSVVARRGAVVATEGPEAARLLGAALGAAPSKPDTAAVGTACLYFAAPAPPLGPDPVLYLNGEAEARPGRLVNNACFPSAVAPSYAAGAGGRTLASVSVIGARPDLSDADLEAAARNELSEWFGAPAVAEWRHLRTYRIPYAQPGQAPPTDFARPAALGSGLYVAGDHRAGATFEGALVSGKRAADALLLAGGGGGGGSGVTSKAAVTAAAAGPAV